MKEANCSALVRLTSQIQRVIHVQPGVAVSVKCRIEVIQPMTLTPDWLHVKKSVLHNGVKQIHVVPY